MYKVALDINRAHNNNTATTPPDAVIPARTEIVIPIDLRSCYFPVDERQKLVKEIEQKRRAREEAKEEARMTAGDKIEVDPREFNPVLHARREERKAKEKALLSHGEFKHGEFSLGASLQKLASSSSIGGEVAPNSAPLASAPVSLSAAGTPRARREQAKLLQEQQSSTSAFTTEKNDLQKKGLHARQVRKAIATSINALRNASEEDALAYKQYCTKIVADRARERNVERLKVEAERKRQMRIIHPERNYSSSVSSSDVDTGDSPSSHDPCLRRVRPPKIKRCHPSTEGSTSDRVHKARRRRQYELTQTVMDPLTSSCITRPTQATVNLHDRQTVKERIQAMETELQNMSSSSSLTDEGYDKLLSSGTQKSTSVRRPPSSQQQLLGSSSVNSGGRRAINRLGQSTIIGESYGGTSTHRFSTAAAATAPTPTVLPPPHSPRVPSKRDLLRTRINDLKGSASIAHRRRIREDGSVSPPLASPRSRSPLNTSTAASTALSTKAIPANVTVRPPPTASSLPTSMPSSACVMTARERHQQGLLSREGDSVHLRRWMAMIFVANSMMALTAPVIRQRLCFHNKIAKVPLSQSEVAKGVHLKFTRAISPNTYDCEMRKMAKEEAKRERRAKRREQRRLLLEKQLSSVGSMWMRTKSGHGGGLSSQYVGGGDPRSLSTSSSDSRGPSGGSDLDDGSISLGGWNDHHTSTQQPASTTNAAPPPRMNLGDIINNNNNKSGIDGNNLVNYDNTDGSALDVSFKYEDAYRLPQPSSSPQKQPLDMRLMVLVGGALAPVPTSTFGCPVSIDFAQINNVPTQITTIHASTAHSTTSERSRAAAGRSYTSGSPSVVSQPHAASSSTYGCNDDVVPKQAVATGYRALLPYINFSNTFDVEAKRVRAAMTVDKCSLRISLYLRIFKKRSAVAYIARFLQERKLVLDLRDGASHYRRCVVSAQRTFRRRRAGVEVVIDHWKKMWREWEADLSERFVEEPSDDDAASLSNTVSRPTTSHLSSSVVAPKQQVLRRRKPKRMTLHEALETPGLKPWFLEDLQAVSCYKYDFPTVCTVATSDGESVLSGKITEDNLTLLMRNVHVSVVHQRTVLRRRRAQYLRQLRSTAATAVDGDAQRQLEDAQRTDAAVNKQVPLRGVGKRDILGLLVYSVLNGGSQAALDTTGVRASALQVSSVRGGSEPLESREASRRGSTRRLIAHTASRPRSPRTRTTQSNSASAGPPVLRRYSSLHEHQQGSAGVGCQLSNTSLATSREPTLPTSLATPSSARIRRITVRAPSVPTPNHHLPATPREGRRGTSSTSAPNNNTATVRRSSVIFVTPPME